MEKKDCKDSEDCGSITDKRKRLLCQIEKEITHFGNESTGHKRLYRWLHYAALGLTALATVLGSASLVLPDHHDAVGFAIVAVTTAANVVVAVETIHKPSELWMLERRIFHMLCDMRRKLEYCGPDGLTNDQLDECFAQLQAVLSASSQKWSQTVKTDTENQAAPKDTGNVAEQKRDSGA
ncbi:MAG: hypothetical protein CDV28_10856 [Candidatus Electronema aureum]|uniref:SMODS and SLOG-associating 2TM effector domain-containing protein n=1 Tax=Candidatus Electronema aureum TaxID=2005002 RepID=A0A521G2S0_9BACT|nr:MAG: hypothetical protein CDV28_10856 [Candidatus Electronema aureum]